MRVLSSYRQSPEAPDRRHTPLKDRPGASPAAGSRPLFAIDWMRRGAPIERETSILTDIDAVIALARSKAPEVAMRHPGREPDSFRLTDSTGLNFGVFPVRQSRDPRRAG
jgi:hypothetical protein